MTERRHMTRVEPRRPLRAKVKASLPARIVDLSASGAQLEVLTSLKPMVKCEVRLQLSDGEVVINSMVRRCRAWGFGFDEADRRVLLYRAGVEFEGVSPELVARLRRELLVHGASSGEAAAINPGQIGSDLPPADDAPERQVSAPTRDGPVKIRISAEHVRGIIDRGNRDEK